MRIYNGADIKEIERLTVVNRKTTWSELMTTAAIKFVKTIFNQRKLKKASKIVVICGPGNNGGDGLEIAKVINQTTSKKVHVWIPDFFSKRSTLNNEHLKCVTHINNINVYSIDRELLTPYCCKDAIIIDALFGIGLDRPLYGIPMTFVDKINKLENYVISVDLPSGLFSNRLNHPSDKIINPKRVVSFQYPKPSFFFEENLELLKICSFANIGLSDSSYKKSSFGEYLTPDHSHLQLVERKLLNYKTENGKAVIVGGAKGMTGAPLLAALAVQTVGAGYSTIQSCSEVLGSVHGHPDLMKSETNLGDHINELLLLNNSTIGIGPGLGTHKDTGQALGSFLEQSTKPLILDADALNLISIYNLKHLIRSSSILTPHIGEFKKLMGKKWVDGAEKLTLLQSFSIDNKCITVLKGPYSCICDEHGKLYFNSTGNPSLAVAGSGDILTGMITGFLAQGYSPIESAIKGVFFHGKAADMYVKEHHMSSMTPISLLTYVEKALFKIKNRQ